MYPILPLSRPQPSALFWTDYWSSIYNIHSVYQNGKSLGLVEWLGWQIHLRCCYPTYALAWVPAALLLVQLAANGLGKQLRNGSRPWLPRRSPWLMASDQHNSGHCSHLRHGPMNGISLSLKYFFLSIMTFK